MVRVVTGSLCGHELLEGGRKGRTLPDLSRLASDLQTLVNSHVGHAHALNHVCTCTLACISSEDVANPPLLKAVSLLGAAACANAVSLEVLMLCRLTTLSSMA